MIIPSFNTRELLADCLDSIAAAAGAIATEVVVVDNGSADASADMVRERFPGVRLLANADNRGFAAAVNQALPLVQGRHVLLLNSDTVLQPGALAALCGFLDRHHEVGVAGPRLLNADGTLQPSWAAFPTLWNEIRGAKRRARRPYKHDGEAYAVDWMDGACLLLRRTAVDQLGGLDERFFIYSEDTDLCFRARQLGWAVCYCPEACVVHVGAQSTRHAAAAMKVELYRSKVLFFRAHYGAARAAVLRALLQAGFVAIAAAGEARRLLGLAASADAAAQARQAMAIVRALRAS